MTATIQILLLFLAVLVVAAVIARRLNTAPSIVLVLAGVALALTPGLPAIALAPEFVLLVILPPLIYSAGVSMSWREFRFNLRPITLLAFGCVVFTAGAVAVAAHYVLGFSWAVGFLLGAIVAPPDVVAPLAIARRLGLPRRLLLVLEGEGLANDATALILYRFAVAAIATGMFSPMQAAGTFAAIVVGELVWGIGVGWLSLRLRRLAREPRVEIVLSLMTPYLAYWVPEHLGGSGVLATLATVAAGLRARQHRCARRRLARGGARDSPDAREWSEISRPRPHSVHHLRRHHAHAGRTGTELAGDHPLARCDTAPRRRASARA